MNAAPKWDPRTGAVVATGVAVGIPLLTVVLSTVRTG